MPSSLRLSAIIPAPPEAVYQAWLDGKQHGAMTGAKASSQARVGGKFTAWDGYITGNHQELAPPQRIVQSWRTTEFPEDSSDSRLEVQFQPSPGGTRLTLVHTELPPGEAERYEVGWRQFYFEPMQRYFAQLRLRSPAAAPGRKRAAPKPPTRSRPGSQKVAAKPAASQPKRSKAAAKPAKVKRRTVRGRK